MDEKDCHLGYSSDLSYTFLSGEKKFVKEGTDKLKMNEWMNG
jgi:hypothetical protein